MARNYYEPGSWNIICDVCGKKIKASQSRQRWDGFIVCPACYEERHPQDFVRARQDKITVPFTRPRPQDIFVSPPVLVCTLITAQGLADIGIADCARAGGSGPLCTLVNSQALADIGIADCARV